MKKRIFWTAAGLLLVCGLIEAFFLLQSSDPAESGAFTGKQLEEHAARLGKKLPPSAPTIVPAKPISPSQPVRLAIGWLGLQDESQNRQAGDLLVAQLGSAKNIQMVDRQSLDAVLRETQLSFSGLVRAQSAVRVGKLLRADWFLLGSVVKTGGSNGIVVRVVDGRTGVFRDAAVLYAENDIVRLTTELATFIRQSRDAASKPPKPRTYLAVGAFQNLGVNNRQADFPAKLRSHLMQAYQGDTNVAILEREFVDALLREVRMDLAGLTEEGTNAVAPIQGAFWLLTGYYQSYEANGFEVEADLRINQMFGTTFSEMVRGAPEEPLFRNIKSKVDASIAKGNSTPVLPTRRSEIDAQIELGKNMSLGIVSRPGVQQRNSISRVDISKTPQLLRDAISAFEAALAIDPDNAEAKMYLAACLEHSLTSRKDEARKLVREVADSPAKDKWTGRALAALGDYAEQDGNYTEAAAWYRKAAEYPTGTVSRESTPYFRTPENFRQLADEMGRENKWVLDPREQLMADVRGIEEGYKSPLKRFGSIFYDDTIGRYMDSFGTNRTEATEAFNKQLPELMKLTPGIAKHLLAAAIVYQQDTNSDVINQFKSSFDQCVADPNNMLQRGAYFSFVQSAVYDWCMANKMYALAEHVIEGTYQADLKPAPPDRFFQPGPPPTEMPLEKRMRLMNARMAMERWADTLEIIKTIPAVPFYIHLGGGQSDLVIPTNLITKCRENLHLPVEKDPRVFKLGKPAWTFHDPTVFVCDDNHLWMAICCRLWKAGLESNTNIEITLPKRRDSRITRLLDGGSKLWIGTDGDGLIEYDKKSGECRKFTESDGLMMNNITELCLRDDDLWIGFGTSDRYENPGGMGMLDLKTGKAIAFTPPLRQIPKDTPLAANYNVREESNGPPRHAVFKILSFSSDSLMVPVFERGLCRYYIASNSWETLSVPWPVRGFFADNRRIVFTLADDSKDNASGLQKMAIAIKEVDGSSFVRIGEVTNVPATGLTGIGVDGNDLWITGVGFLGVVDLEKKSLRKYCYSEMGGAAQVQVAGGYVWALFGNGICRIPVKDTK